MMSREEERELIVAWRERGDEAALMRLTQQHQALFRAQGRKHLNARFDWDDVAQQAAIGIKRAAEKFDLSREERFVTYASWFTRDEISVAGRKNSNSVTVPQSHMTGKGREIWEAWNREMTDCATSGADGSEAAVTRRVAAALKVTEERVRSVVEAWQMGDHSIDAPLAGEDGDRERPLPSLLVDQDNAESLYLRQEAESQSKQILDALMSCLDPRERDIIHRRRFLNETLEEVSKSYNVSRERIRQLEARAMGKMAAAGAAHAEAAAACLQELRD